ncbi:hypothetical protein PMIN04_007864 [Paraphaeosphaeria minitans]
MAHISLRHELEAPNLFKLQACLLLLHPRPPDIDSVETPSTWILAAQATACAQMIGLHRDPTEWNIAAWEKSLRRKLWWATYMADCWSAVCHGNPSHIHDTSFDTQSLDIDDMNSDEEVPSDLKNQFPSAVSQTRLADGLRFLEAVKISRHLHDNLECAFQVNPNQQSITSSPSDRLATLEMDMRDWKDVIPSCLGLEKRGPSQVHWNGQSKLLTAALLYRGLMYPATSEAKAEPSSSLRRWFAAALTAFKPFTDFVSALKDDDLDYFWTRHARSQLILCGNFLIYLFILALGPDEVKSAYQLLDWFHQALQRLGVSGNSNVHLLLRPLKLRIDSLPRLLTFSSVDESEFFSWKDVGQQHLTLCTESVLALVSRLFTVTCRIYGDILQAGIAGKPATLYRACLHVLVYR